MVMKIYTVGWDNDENDCNVRMCAIVMILMMGI